jgi:3-dehydroquinate synthase II
MTFGFAAASSVGATGKRFIAAIERCAGPATSITPLRRRRSRTPALSLSAPSTKLWWCETSEKTALTSALEAGLEDFVFRDADRASEFSTLARFHAVVVDSTGRFQITDGPGGQQGEFVDCRNADDVRELQKRALSGSGNAIAMYVVDTQAESTWSVIPSENLIAIKQQNACSSKFMVVVSTVDEARAMINLLDTGVDGVLLRTNNVSEILRYGLLKAEHDHSVTGQNAADVCYAKINQVQRVGSGDRACLDFCSLLDETEGVFVGSSSQAMFLVLSEAAKNDYVPSRAFRCNAGPVHSYVLCANGKTKYLSELEAGDELLVIKADGERQTTRTVVLGRVKIENRPLVLVQAEIEPHGPKCNILLQNAETVRIACLSGDALTGRSIVELAPGDRVLVRVDAAARHVGLPIHEFLLEK